MLVKNEIVAQGLTSEEKDAIKTLIRQKPNTRVFGLRSYMWFYVWGSHGNPKSKFSRKFKAVLRKVGEEPAIIDSNYILGTEKQMSQFMFNKGYFYASVTHSVRQRKLIFSSKHRQIVEYKIIPNNRYTLGLIYYNIPDSNIYKLIVSDTSKSYLVRFAKYDLDNLIREKNRITDILRDNGYYYFSRDYVNYDIDSNYQNNYVMLSANVRNPGIRTHKQTRIKSIQVELDNDLAVNPRIDTIEYKGILYILKGYKIKPVIIDRMIQIHPGELYNQTKVQDTYSRLLDMQLFRYVNISFETYGSDSSGWINCRIKMNPHMANEFVEEPQAITSDQNNNLSSANYRNYGIANSLLFRNKNTFHRAEILQVTWRAALEMQPKSASKGKFYSTEQNINISLSQPRLIWLPRSWEGARYASKNRTSVSLAYTYETNLDFKRNLLTASFNYQHRRKLFTFSWSPIEVNFIKTNPSQAFQDSLNKVNDVFLKSLFSNNLITDGRFTIIYDNQIKRPGKSFVRIVWDPVEIGGNMVYFSQKLLFKPAKDPTTQKYKLLGLTYYQYYRSVLDFRYNHIFDVNNRIVTRFYAGAGIPYGNASIMPLERRFFVGGANDLRAFRPRVIGPGFFADKDSLGIDRSGEIKLEVNMEYRFNIIKRYLEGALFADAGNIWLARRDDKTYPGGAFNIASVPKQLAIDGGIGLRLNFTFFIFRLDAAIPFQNPQLNEGQRWVLNQIGNKGWVRKEAQLNVAIGYPF